MPPRPTVNVLPGNNFRCSASRSRSRTTSTSRGYRPGSAPRATHRRPPPTPRWCAGCGAGAVIVGKTNTCELGQWPFTSGPGFGHTRNPWSRRHSPGGSSGGSAAAVAAGLVPAAIGSDGAGSVRIPAPGRTWWASNRSAGASRPGRCRRPSTASPSTGCWPAPSPTRPWCSTPPPATPTAICTSPPRCGSPSTSAAPRRAAHRGVHGVPVQRFRSTLHPEIAAALQGVADQLEQLGHTVRRADPDYGLRMSFNFLARSTAGLVEWSQRLGRTCGWTSARAATSTPAGCCPSTRCARPAPPRPTRSAGWLDLQHRRRGDRPDHRAAAPTGRRVRRPRPAGHRPGDDPRLPLTWPWNLLGWPSINVPAGFTSAGLPIGCS